MSIFFRIFLGIFSFPFGMPVPALAHTGDMIASFYCYSFLGFALEWSYAKLVHAKKPDRKCRLLLPICPVYGVGAVAIVSLPQAIQARPILLFFAAALVSSVTEYAASVFYQRVWRVSFWDYRGLPGNIHGRICLPFSLAWGALGWVLVYWVHPKIAAALALLPDTLLIPFTLLFLVDLALTGHLLRASGTTRVLRWYE
jgi:uncharacterized membrane protein